MEKTAESKQQFTKQDSKMNKYIGNRRSRQRGNFSKRIKLISKQFDLGKGL